MMPSTSVQIHSSEASSAAERIDAEKSEPPRPSVVGRPSAVAPLKPVTTGRTPCSSSGSRRARALARVGSISGEAFPKTASVTTIRSEEHTSELQSLRHLVCRLLLEKTHKFTFIVSHVHVLLYFDANTTSYYLS